MRCLRRRGALAVGERGKIHAVNDHAALGGLGQPAQQVKQSGLAGAGGADNGHKLPRLDGKRNSAHRSDCNRPAL